MARSQTFVKAMVQSVIRISKGGPYAVAKVKGVEGSITFSLKEGVWAEEQWPEPGTYVFLDKLSQNRAGWRAAVGRLWRPSDKQSF